MSAYAEREHNAELDSCIDRIVNSDTVRITVKYFTLTKMQEIGRDVGVPVYGSRAAIAYRIQSKLRYQKTHTVVSYKSAIISWASGISPREVTRYKIVRVSDGRVLEIGIETKKIAEQRASYIKED